VTVSHDAYSAMSAEAPRPEATRPRTPGRSTPSGTPKGVLVWAVPTASNLVSGDNAVTGVTYGGVPMTKVAEDVPDHRQRARRGLPVRAAVGCPDRGTDGRRDRERDADLGQRDVSVLDVHGRHHGIRRRCAPAR